MIESPPCLVSESARERLQVVGVVTQIIERLLALRGVAPSLLEAGLNGQLGHGQATPYAVVEGLPLLLRGPAGLARETPGGQFNSFVEISTDFSTDFSTEFFIVVWGTL